MVSYTKKESGVSTLFFIFTYTFQLEFVLIPIKAVKRFSEFLPLESYSHLQSLEDEILYHILFIFKTYFNFKFNFFIFLKPFLIFPKLKDEPDKNSNLKVYSVFHVSHYM